MVMKTISPLRELVDKWRAEVDEYPWGMDEGAAEVARKQIAELESILASMCDLSLEACKRSVPDDECWHQIYDEWDGEYGSYLRAKFPAPPS